MPYSFTEYKNEFRDHLIQNLAPNSMILDVGPGAGVYADVLRGTDFNIDCVEIWEPYVYEFDLHSKYRKVHVTNVMNFDITNYDYLIMGDILEHLTVGDAHTLINRITSMNKKCMVAVPYLYEQGAWGGNPFEEHKQPDLTKEIMKSRYPSLNLLWEMESYGYYINYTATQP